MLLMLNLPCNYYECYIYRCYVIYNISIDEINWLWLLSIFAGLWIWVVSSIGEVLSNFF
jgi:hypothetical protein